jgi:acetyl/propionyl-CoA carboxylase alpha subunit
MQIGGLQTDAGFLRWLVDDEAFASGRYDTSIISTRWNDGPALTPEELSLVARAGLDAREAMRGVAVPAVTGPSRSAWAEAARRDGLRR